MNFVQVEAYKPELIWSDGDWESPPEYWKGILEYYICYYILCSSSYICM